MSVVKNSVGRPKENGSKNKQYRLRMTDEEFKSLDVLSSETGESKSDIIREALRMYRNLHNFRAKNEE